MDTSAPDEPRAAPSAPLDLYEYALAQARAAAERRELTKDAGEMGVDISWYNKFAAGKIPGASYKKIHRVASFYLARQG